MQVETFLKELLRICQQLEPTCNQALSTHPNTPNASIILDHDWSYKPSDAHFKTLACDLTTVLSEDLRPDFLLVFRPLHEGTSDSLLQALLLFKNRKTTLPNQFRDLLQRVESLMEDCLCRSSWIAQASGFLENPDLNHPIYLRLFQVIYAKQPWVSDIEFNKKRSALELKARARSALEPELKDNHSLKTLARRGLAALSSPKRCPAEREAEF